MSVRSLANAIKSAMDERVKNEARAMYGTIKDGRFVNGSKSFNYVEAVDCDTSDGSKVWAQRSQNGSAVIVGS